MPNLITRRRFSCRLDYAGKPSNREPQERYEYQLECEAHMTLSPPTESQLRIYPRLTSLSCTKGVINGRSETRLGLR